MDEWQKSLGYVRGSNIYVRGYFGFMCLVFKTTYIDRRKPLREDAFFLHEKDTCSPASYHCEAVECVEKEVNKRAKVLKNSVPL